MCVCLCMLQQGLNRLAHSLVWASARGQQPGHSRHSPALTIRAYAAQPGAAQQETENALQGGNTESHAPILWRREPEAADPPDQQILLDSGQRGLAKWCSACSLFKPVSKFRRQWKALDGRMHQCIDCRARNLLAQKSDARTHVRTCLVLDSCRPSSAMRKLQAWGRTKEQQLARHAPSAL